MSPTNDGLSAETIKADLQRLRQGQALARPTSVRQLKGALRAVLVGDDGSADDADEVMRTVDALRGAIERMGAHERYVAQVDFNLVAEHSFATLTERQESLARARKCTAKTIRRHSDQALDTLVLIIRAGRATRLGGDTEGVPSTPKQHAPIAAQRPWPQTLGRFWRLAPEATVDVVCSEIPAGERPEFASPTDRNYLRYAKFADLDSLIYVRTRLAQICPTAAVRDFSPSEHFSTDANALIVIGGPPWNAKFREFVPQLPFFFDPHPLGEDDPMVVPQLGVRLAPRWTDGAALLEDIAVFTRLTLARGTTVYLMAGCLTLGVLGAAQCFLHAERGAANAEFIDAAVGDADFVLVTAARRVGGITDVADLSRVEPQLLLARRDNESFDVIIDNASRGRKAVQVPSPRGE